MIRLRGPVRKQKICVFAALFVSVQGAASTMSFFCMQESRVRLLYDAFHSFNLAEIGIELLKGLVVVNSNIHSVA